MMQTIFQVAYRIRNSMHLDLKITEILQDFVARHIRCQIISIHKIQIKCQRRDNRGIFGLRRSTSGSKKLFSEIWVDRMQEVRIKRNPEGLSCSKK